MSNAHATPQSSDAAGTASTIQALPNMPNFLATPRCEHMPAWPAGAQEKHESGTTSLAIKIDVSGSVAQVDIKKPSGYPDLDVAARDAFQQCRFPVQKQGGEAVAYVTGINYIWQAEKKAQTVPPTVQLSLPASMATPKCENKPAWPAGAQERHESGTTTMSVKVDADGSVLQVNVQKSTGYRDLDVSARDAFQLCKFAVVKADGVAAPYYVGVQYVWVPEKKAD